MLTTPSRPAAQQQQSAVQLSPQPIRRSIFHSQAQNTKRRLASNLRYNLAASTSFHLRSLASQFSNPPWSWGRLAGNLAPSRSSTAPSWRHLFLISRRRKSQWAAAAGQKLRGIRVLCVPVKNMIFHSDQDATCQICMLL